MFSHFPAFLIFLFFYYYYYYHHHHHHHHYYRHCHRYLLLLLLLLFLPILFFIPYSGTLSWSLKKPPTCRPRDDISQYWLIQSPPILDIFRLSSITFKRRFVKNMATKKDYRVIGKRCWKTSFLLVKERSLGTSRYRYIKILERLRKFY